MAQPPWSGGSSVIKIKHKIRFINKPLPNKMVNSTLNLVSGNPGVFAAFNLAFFITANQAETAFSPGFEFPNQKNGLQKSPGTVSGKLPETIPGPT